MVQNQLPSKLLSRYQISQELSFGGFGNTYLAIDTALPDNPLCVVKHLSPKDSSPEGLSIAKKLFEREAKCLHQLGKKHEQIPTLYAYFCENEQFYLVQEYIQGNPLTEELTPGKQCSETDVIILLRDILQVLEFIHQKQVIHRDLKPSNLIRRACDRKIVLIDFGAVKQISTQTIDSQGNAASTVAVGTPEYMPCEQTMGHPRPCSDIYALGIIAIQALTGIKPKNLTKNKDTLELTWRNQAPQVSDELATILDKMVRYDCRDRYQNISQVLQHFLVLEKKAVIVNKSRSENLPSANPIVDSLDATIPLGMQ